MAAKKEDHNHTPAAVASDTRPATFMRDPASSDPTKMVQVGPQKVDLEDFDQGTFRKNDEPENAEPYHLKIVEDDLSGQTHHLKNQDHYWSGTKEQFKLQFEKA